MRLYVALCVERYENNWNVVAEIQKKTRREVEDEIVSMLERCICAGESCDRYEKNIDGYDYVLFEKDENDEENIVFRYKIIDLEV